MRPGVLRAICFRCASGTTVFCRICQRRRQPACHVWCSNCRGLRGMSIVLKTCTRLRLPAESGNRKSWCAVGTSAAGFRLCSERRSHMESTASKRTPGEVRILPLAVSGEIHAGQSLSAILLVATKTLRLRFQNGDILVVKHKAVSKAEGALVALDEVHPSKASRIWARRYRLGASVG